MNGTNMELCAEAYHLQSNFFFQCTQFFLAFICATGAILILYISTVIFIKKVFHINLRILLLNLLALLLLRSFLVVFRSSTFIYRLITYKDYCSFLENSIRCSVLSICGAAPLKSLRYAFTAITAERFIAMCFYQRYEKWKYPIALLFLPLTWHEIATSIKDIVSVLNKSQKTYRSYCSSITSRRVPYLKLALEIPILFGIFFLLLITRTISKRKMILQTQASVDSLSSRYQIRENMKTSKTMFITTIMYIISSLLNLSGIILLTHLPTTDLLNFAIFKEITSFAIAIFINALSILLIVRVERKNGKVIKWLRPFRCNLSNKVQEEPGNQPPSGRQHIQIIEQMWQKGIPK